MLSEARGVVPKVEFRVEKFRVRFVLIDPRHLTTFNNRRNFTTSPSTPSQYDQPSLVSRYTLPHPISTSIEHLIPVTSASRSVSANIL
jgi:hypothetical protein